METPKQKAIREAYGEDYERISKREYGIDNEGFSNFYEHGNETFLDGYEIFCGHTVEDIVKVRPLGLGEKLENLKNNNGWIRIESKEHYDSLDNGHYEWYNINTGRYDKGDLWDYGVFTHYKNVPIIKPEPPIY